MIRTALKNPLAVLMICIALIVFSGVITPRLTVDTFPELTPPVLVIGTQAPGMGPRDVETTITWRFEKYVSATPGVDHVQSVSRAGLSVIYVWLKWGTNLDSAQTLVQQQVQFAMSSVPKSLGVVPPFVLQYDPTNAPVVQVAVYGGGLPGPQLYDYAANTIEPALEGIPGVASASPNGGRERQMNIVVDPVRAAALGVTSSEVAAAVARANALLPSGRLLSPDLDANVYTNAVPKKISDLEEATIKVIDGRPVLIRDVARIEDGGGPDTQTVFINGDPAVYLNVLRVPGGNVPRIVDQVNERIAELKLPAGMKVKPVFDQSTFVRSTQSGLKKEIIQEFFLVAMVILLFLQSWRSVVVAAIAVPISFAIILIVLYVSGQTLNAFTLGGLTLAMGPLVDISVVVLESIHRERLKGKPPARAALDGTSAVAGATLAATLATVSVLLPVVLLQGLAQKLFAPLAITVASGMVAGYAVSMIVTPVACRYILGHHAESPAWMKRIEHFIDRIAGGYRAALERVLPNRVVVVIAAAVLIGGSGWAAKQLPSTFFPELDESMERVYVRFAPGTSVENAGNQLRDMGKVLQDELPPGSVDLVLTNSGAPGKARSAMNSPNAGPHMGFIRLELTPPGERKESQREIADQMRRILTERYPGVDFLEAPGGLVATVFNNGYNAPIVVEIEDPNLDTLRATSVAVVDVAREVPGLRDPYVTLETDYPELHVDTDRQVAGLVGASPRDAAQTTLEATLGNINTPGVWVDAGNGQSYFVVTFYDPLVVHDRDSLAAVPLRATSDHGAIALGTYATIGRDVGPIAIERNHLSRVATVLLQTEGRDIGSASEELERKLHDDPRTKDQKIRFVGQVELMRSTFSGLGVAIGLAVMVVFIIMVTQFRSLRLPLAMLFTIPVTFVGVVLALMAAGQGLSITSLMGLLMVIGIAMSNGILLVDQANRDFQGGKEMIPAVLDAGRTRFIPIMMTSLATIIGLAPTALGLDPEAASNRPLALAVVGGMLLSTALSLFLVPVMFTLLVKRQKPDESLDAVPSAIHA
ncbi:efflux RND transporter permease subunit [soil metagenome]